MTDSIPPVTYALDTERCLVEADGDWSEVSEPYLGQSIWRFVRGNDLRLLYEHLFDQAWVGTAAAFRYRCDSPTHYRTFELKIARDADLLRVSSRFLTREPRAQPLSVVGASRGQTLIVRCSICSRFGRGKRWLELDDISPEEEAAGAGMSLRVFHGVCPTCLAGLRQPPG